MGIAPFRAKNRVASFLEAESIWSFPIVALMAGDEKNRLENQSAWIRSENLPWVKDKRL